MDAKLGIFSKTISVLEKSLDLRSMKHNIIVSNIANMDTPNYKAFDLIIEDEIGKQARKSNNIDCKKTSPGHLAGKKTRMDDVKIAVSDPLRFSMKVDGNTVDIDTEMAKLSENALMYNVSAQILSRKFQGLKDVIKGGGN